MRAVTVVVWVLVGLGAWFLPGKAEAAYCTKFGGTQYDLCYRAKVVYQAAIPNGVPSGYIFPTRLSAAQWAAGQLYATGVVDGVDYKQCQYGLRTSDTPVCQNLVGWGSGCGVSRVDEDYSHFNSSVNLWGFESPSASYPNGRVNVCQARYDMVSANAVCPKGWSVYFEYPYNGDPNRPMWYCEANSNAPANNPTADHYTGTPDGPSTADKSGACASCGLNPVNLGTGSKYDAVVDYDNHSPFPIRLVRYYSNAADGWHFNYDRKILALNLTPNSTVAVATLLREDGTHISFKSTDADPTVNSSSWTWNPIQYSSVGSNTILSTFSVQRTAAGVLSGYVVKNLRGETESYNADGLMTQIANENGKTLTLQYDANQKLTRIDDSYGRHLDLSYSGLDVASQTWVDPQGTPSNPNTTASYEMFSSLGAKSAYVTYNLPTHVSDGTQSVSYTYDVDIAQPDMPARLRTVQYADGTTIGYTYNGPSDQGYRNWLKNIIGGDGEIFATYTYDGWTEKIAQSTHGSGLRKITYWNGEVGDAYNHYFQYYNGSQYTAGKPTGFPNGACPPEVCSGEGSRAKALTFDSYGNPLTITDYNNQVRTYTWDAPRALPLTITEATGTSLARTTTFTWHATKRLPLTKVEPIKVGGTTGTRTTTYAYDSNGYLLSETVSNSINSDTRSQSWTYNSLGVVASHTDARGHTTTYTYDTQANLLTATNALSQVTTWSNYNDRGLPQTMTNANGLETRITYDARDRVTQVMRGSSASHWETWNISWLAINKMDRITRPDGISYKMLYDSAHDLIEVQERSASDALLGKRVFTLDLMGRLTKEETFDASGTKLTTGGQTWSTLSRLASQTGALSQSTTFTYDADGNLTGVADPLTHTQGSAVDALGRTISMVDQLNHSSTLTYDVQDNLTGGVDARGVSTGYAYNAFNDLLAISSPDRGSSTMSVDANGNTITTTDARGADATVVYDDLDRPTSVAWSDDNVSGTPTGFTAGDKTVSYTWDSCTHGIGKLCSKSDWTGSYSYTYDLWGRLTGSSFAPAGESFTLSTGYGFDSYGRENAIVYPSGKALTYTFGNDGRPNAISWAGTGLLGSLGYQAMNGPVSGWTWSASGIPSTKAAVAFTYDLDGRMSHISDIEEIDLLHDLDNRLTGETHLPSSDPDMAYTYDAKDRLTQADNALWSGAVSYGYDFGDNRTSKTWNTDGWQNAYASTSNRLSSITPVVSGVAGTAVSVSMDAMGNTINDGLRTFSYDATGRMVAVSNGGSAATYLVNSDGLRVRKAVTGIGATNEIVAYDDMRRRVGVYQANGSGGFTVKEELVYLPGSWRLVSTVRGQVAGGSDGVAYPVLSDQIGTPRVVLDPSSGDRRWEWSAKEAFGLQAPNENPDSLTAGAFVFDARFPGQYLDAETGLFHNGYRDYDPKVGRYVESDPLGLGAGWNTYGYVGGNPVTSMDPFGLEEVMVAIWLPQANLNSITGHVALSSMDMQQIYTSQWPVNRRNTTPNWAHTRWREGGRVPDRVYAVNVPDIEAFKKHLHVATNPKLRWSEMAGADPFGFSTNCVEAAVDSLRAGGVSVVGASHASLLSLFMGNILPVNTPSGLNQELYLRSKIDPSVRELTIPVASFPKAETPWTTSGGF